ncbi:hypothetical protein N431DRAFT_31082 [Stipitochalara longipes BDJ]|nr:hypothetical protein N431DRAFT_31082 [Stipitochalara longipes BDJ]
MVNETHNAEASPGESVIERRNTDTEVEMSIVTSPTTTESSTGSELKSPAAVTIKSINTRTSTNKASPWVTYKRKRPSFSERIGSWNSLALTIATLTNLVCLCFLTFLWFSNTRNSTWQAIALRGWIPRAVTLTAMVMRWDITFQAAICTSQLASLLLEKFEVCLPDAAGISLLTSQNMGPISILMYFRTTLKRSSFAIRIALLALTVSTLLLQFSSSALLSDINLGLIEITQTNVSYGVRFTEDFIDKWINQAEHDMGGVIVSTPSGYPAFGEYTEAPTDTNQSGIVDTGVSMRAFFPVSTEPGRDRLVKYNGLAQVVDTRVVCMRPILSDLSLTGFDEVIFPNFLDGRFRTNMSVPGFPNDSNLTDTATFKCAFPSMNPELPISEWPLSICNPDYPDDLMVSPLVGGAKRPLQTWGNIAFVLNMTGTFTFPQPMGCGNSSDCPVAIGVQDVQDDGEWVQISTTNSTLSLSMTACYSSVVSKALPIKAWRKSQNITEPAAVWRAESMTYDTRDVRHQLGISGPKEPAIPFDDRGVFAFINESSWEHWEPGSIDTFLVDDAIADLIEVNNGTTLMCTMCINAGPVTDAASVMIAEVANGAHSALFQDILQHTLNPAVALQSTYTVLFGMAYYNSLVKFGVSANATTVETIDVLRPVSKRFYTGILVVNLMHLSVVIFITALFYLKCQYVLLGNNWNVFAGFRSQETEPWLDRANGVEDGTMRDWMATAKQDKIQVGLKDVEGRLQIAKRE